MSERLYRITVHGRLTERMAPVFDGFRLEPDPEGTVLSGVCVDSSALFGVLDRVRDLGLELLAVESAPVAAGAVEPTERQASA
jgi:hypothetical protein